VGYWLARFQLAPSVEVVVCPGKTLGANETAEGRIRWHNHRNQTRIYIPDGYDEAGTDWRIIHEVMHQAYLEMNELQQSILRRLDTKAAELADDVLDEAEERLVSRVATPLAGPLPFPKDE
jgi:hypothetical protein